jgi:hypothetical protein
MRRHFGPDLRTSRALLAGPLGVLLAGFVAGSVAGSGIPLADDGAVADTPAAAPQQVGLATGPLDAPGQAGIRTVRLLDSDPPTIKR